jgi:hypothetical protein
VVNREDAAARAEFDRVLAEIARRLPDLIDGQCDEVVICIDAIEEPVSDDVRRGPCDDDFRLLANVVANIRPGIRRDARKSSGGIDFEKPVAIEIEVISL